MVNKRYFIVALTTVALTGLACCPASAAVVGSNGNLVNSINTSGYLKAGNTTVRVTYKATCNPNDYYYTRGDYSTYDSPTIYATLSQTINGVVWTSSTTEFAARPGGAWDCTGAARLINQGAVQQNGQPAWRAGAARLTVTQYGYDPNGNQYQYTKSQNVTIQ